MTDVQLEPIPSETAVRLTAFARACKGAARAVSLYPPEHPAVGESLGRLAAAAGTATEAGPLTMMVVPDNLLVEGRALDRPDAAVADLAFLLHAHRVGEFSVQPGVDARAWHTLLTLLGHDPEEVRAQGGLARALTTAGAIGLAVTEIDYASLFEASPTLSEASWESVIARCLDRDVADLDEETLRLLGSIASDAARLAEFFERLEAHEGPRSTGGLGTALLATMRAVADYLEREGPEAVARALDNMAAAISHLSPDFVLQIVAIGNAPGSEFAPLVAEMLARVTDPTLAEFVARTASRERTASARLAEAVRALAPDPRRREAVAALTRGELARTEAAEDDRFESLWAQVADMLTTYNDSAYVSAAYDGELTTAQRRAGELSRAADDPPERIIAWLKTVSDASVRALDLRLLVDLLSVERERRREIVQLVADQVGQLVDLGDFPSARQLVGALAARREAADSPEAAQEIADALAQLAAGPFMTRVAAHLQAARDDEFEHVKAMCAAIGPALASGLAEVLASEARPRARKRLADLLMAFGQHGRESIERLKNSPSPTARRTAVHLLKLCGGPESVPDLAQLVADADAAVRRDAARALIGLALDEAFDALRGVLSDAAHPGRQALVEELGTTRDPRAAQLLCHIVQHMECRGALRPVYLQSLARLGVLGGQDAVDALADVLGRGRWWAPFATREIREEAAAALARIPLPGARAALEKAAADGPFGARAAARRHLKTP